MKQKLLFFVIAFFPFSFTYAQLLKYRANYVPATIWFSKEDSLSGFLDFQEWTLTPPEISFKKNMNEKAVQYDATQITAFQIRNGERWISYSGYIDQRAVTDAELTDHPVADSAFSNLFIRVLYSGKKSLFYVRDLLGRDHFFFSSDQRKITEFHVNRYIKYLVADFQDPTSPSKYIVENREYKGQLIALLGDCRKLESKIKYSNILYDQGDFLKLFQEYHECTQAKVDYQGKKDSWQFVPTLNGGIDFSTLKVNYADAVTQIDSTYHNHSFTFGLGLDCILPRNLGHWSIYNDLFVRANNYGTLTVPNQGFNLNYAYIKLATLIRYYRFYTPGKFYPEIGMSNGINIRQNLPKDENDLAETSGDYEQGLVLGAGTIWHNINLEARFEIATIYSPAVVFYSSSHTIYLMAGYYFK